MGAFPKNRLNARRTFASNDKAKRSKYISKRLLERIFEKKPTGIKNPAAKLGSGDTGLKAKRGVQ